MTPTRFLGPLAVGLIRQPDGAPIIDGASVHRVDTDDRMVQQALDAARAHAHGAIDHATLQRAVETFDMASRRATYGGVGVRIPRTSVAVVVGLRGAPPPPTLRRLRVRLTRRLTGRTAPPPPAGAVGSDVP